VAYAIILLVAVVAVSLVPQIIRMRRLSQRMRQEDPEWVAAWKRASRSRKRRIGRALRHGNTLYDAGDARLLVGLSRRADLYQETAGRRLRYSLPLVAVIIAVAVSAGHPGLAVQAVVVLGLTVFLHRVVLPRQRARRHRAVATNRQIHGGR
jgi:hypothetical protein